MVAVVGADGAGWEGREEVALWGRRWEETAGEVRAELDDDGFGEALFRLREMEVDDGTLWPLWPL